MGIAKLLLSANYKGKKNISLKVETNNSNCKKSIAEAELIFNYFRDECISKDPVQVSGTKITSMHSELRIRTPTVSGSRYLSPATV